MEKSTFILGVSGASCSGKTWLTNQIKNIRPQEVTIFELDNYYKSIEYVSSLKYRHDNPDSIDFEKAIEDFKLLQQGQEITLPSYDFATHKVTGERIVIPTQFIIVEGIFAFSNPWLTQQMDLKIWVDTDEEKCLTRRIDRDTKERGRTSSQIIDRYRRDVSPAFKTYIYPHRKEADIYIENNNENKKIGVITDLIWAYVDRKINNSNFIN